MSIIGDMHEEEAIQQYRGVPNHPGSEEITRWRAFGMMLKPLMRWLDKHKRLAERFFVAKVDGIEAKNRSMRADAQLKEEQAKKVAAEAREIELNKLADLRDGRLNYNQQLETFMTLVSQFRTIYGGNLQIKFEIKDDADKEGILPIQNIEILANVSDPKIVDRKDLPDDNVVI